MSQNEKKSTPTKEELPLWISPRDEREKRGIKNEELRERLKYKKFTSSQKKGRGVL